MLTLEPRVQEKPRAYVRSVIQAVTSGWSMVVTDPRGAYRVPQVF